MLLAGRQVRDPSGSVLRLGPTERGAADPMILGLLVLVVAMIAVVAIMAVLVSAAWWLLLVAPLGLGAWTVVELRRTR